MAHRRYGIGFGGWILGSVAGAIVAALATAPVLVLHWIAGDGVVVAAVALVPLAIGVGQWLALRRTVSRAGWWVLANAVGRPTIPVGTAVMGLLLGAGRP